MKVLKTTKTKLGNEIQLIGDENSRPILIVGVFHGEEPQGKFLIDEYLKKYTPLSLTLPLEGGGSRYTKTAFENAKKMRQNLTDAEQVLWNVLRAKRLNGLHFKRQQPIGKYIVDFVCFAHKLVIEIDGGQHNEIENITKDNERTYFLEQNGFKVIRIWNNEIFKNLDGVVEYILYSLPPRGGGLGRGEDPKNPLLFIPCLNPDGMAVGKRTNANEVDLNRNYPTKNWELTEKNEFYGGEAPASEIETKFMLEILEEYKPELILALHAPFKVVNYDGPAKEIAEKISDIIGYPVEASIGYPTPGSFGTYCGVERNIPTITLELDEEIPVQDLLEQVHKIFDLL